MGEDMRVIYPGAQFLSTRGPMKLKKVLCSQNTVVGQAWDNSYSYSGSE